jgi:acetyl esterase
MPLDSHARAVLDQLAAAKMPALELLSPVDARAASGMLSAASPPGPEVGAVTSVSIPGRGAAIPARVYAPLESAKGLMVYYHGGGWVLGDLDSTDAFVRILVKHTGCVAVSVDYRLAPEHRFPAAVDDAYDALCWCFDNVKVLAGRAVPLIVAGDSAGANLATVAAILDRNVARRRIAMQMLLYPVTDCAMDTPSYVENATGLLLTRDLMAWFWGHYVDDVPARADFRCSPLRAQHLSGLPPAFIQTAEYDPLRDEGEAYARRLAEAGTQVCLQRRLGLIHGYAGMTAMIPAAQEAISQAILAANRVFAVPGP